MLAHVIVTKSHKPGICEFHGMMKGDLNKLSQDKLSAHFFSVDRNFQFLDEIIGLSRC